MTKRTLRPVDQITRTVQAIQADGDLSQRVSLGKGNDEIYRLASTFDSMLAQIENSMVRERQFTSDVAHGLRTPLSTMTLICDNLLSDNHLEASTREDLLLLQKRCMVFLTWFLSFLCFPEQIKGVPNWNRNH